MKKLFIALSIIAFSSSFISAAEEGNKRRLPLNAEEESRLRSIINKAPEIIAAERAEALAQSKAEAWGKNALEELLKHQDPELTNPGARLIIIADRLQKARELAIQQCNQTTQTLLLYQLTNKPIYFEGLRTYIERYPEAVKNGSSTPSDADITFIKTLFSKQ